MNTEQERADFEAWYQHHHGDRDVYALDESGEYADKQVQGAFNVWQARAALQSQDREDAERWRVMKERSVVTFMDDYGRKLMIATVDVDRFPNQTTMEGFIDHARRIEGDGE